MCTILYSLGKQSSVKYLQLVMTKHGSRYFRRLLNLGSCMIENGWLTSARHSIIFWLMAFALGCSMLNFWFFIDGPKGLLDSFFFGVTCCFLLPLCYRNSTVNPDDSSWSGKLNMTYWKKTPWSWESLTYFQINMFAFHLGSHAAGEEASACAR